VSGDVGEGKWGEGHTGVAEGRGQEDRGEEEEVRKCQRKVRSKASVQLSSGSGGEEDEEKRERTGSMLVCYLRQACAASA